MCFGSIRPMGIARNTMPGWRQFERPPRRSGQPIGVLVDLAGPKMRLGELPGGQMRCAMGDQLRFIRGKEMNKPDEVTTTYEPLVDELSAGDRILLADGTVSLVVEHVGRDEAVCRVIQPGTVRSRQGVNLPGVKLSVLALAEVDRDNARWAVRNGVDFLGLSFVRSPDDIRDLKSLIAAEGGGTQVIAKIEKPEALEQLEEIVEVTDGVMVARGDLGVEIDIAQMAVAQKRIIGVCNKARKTGNHCHPDARQHDAFSDSDACGGHGCGQRDSGRHRCVHAFGGDGDWSAPSRGSEDDAPDCPGDRADLSQHAPGTDAQT